MRSVPKRQGHPAKQDPRGFEGLAIYPTPTGQVLIGVGPIGQHPAAFTLVCPTEAQELARELLDAAALAGERHG
jgi:hypothetical protein